MAEENQEPATGGDAPKEERASATDDVRAAEATDAGETLAHEVAPNVDSQPQRQGTEAGKRGAARRSWHRRLDKMTNTIVFALTVDKHPKYRRYVAATSKFMAPTIRRGLGDKGASSTDALARKRWRVSRCAESREVGF